MRSRTGRRSDATGFVAAKRSFAYLVEFELSEEHQLLQSTIKNFIKNEIEPYADEIDKTEEFPSEIIKKAGSIGLLGIPFPEEYGGAGAGKIGYCILNEAVGYSSAAVGTIIGAHIGIASMSIYLGGTEEQKTKYLIPMAQGIFLGAFALTEPAAGSDAANIKTTAIPYGDKFILNGTKIWITNGAKADVFIVYAKVVNHQITKSPNHQITQSSISLTSSLRGGITAFIVEKGIKGFSVGTIEKHMGIRGSSTAELIFDNCIVPSENILGQVGGGFVIAMGALDSGRLGLGAGCIGLAQRCLDLSIEFAKQRVQFGKPIIKQQAIQFKLADMATEIYAGRQMVYHAARKSDNNKKITKESAMVKLFCSQLANRCAYSALQIHGGMGYMCSYPIERLYRDARIMEIYEGTSEIQRLIIAMQLIREKR